MRVFLFLILVNLLGCSPSTKEVILEEPHEASKSFTELGLARLSDYKFFSGRLRDLNPGKNVFPYEVNAPLFSDYALKKRFIFLPEGKKIRYNENDVFEFPEGTVIIKNFIYENQGPKNQDRILETRLLIKRAQGWNALPYVWDDEQTDAFLEPAGAEKKVTYTTHIGEVLNINYSIPNQNQCKNCHGRGDRLMPIGPSARQLNRSAGTKNQLITWSDKGILSGLPSIDEMPMLINYEEKNYALNDRARSWLEANCAHCHRDDGSAKTSGLHLLASVTNPLHLGVGKAPVAAGRGSGGRKYDIVPGSPEESILYHRIQSNDPGVMMPELGRKVMHKEGVELISAWIKEMN